MTFSDTAKISAEHQLIGGVGTNKNRGTWILDDCIRSRELDYSGPSLYACEHGTL
jgi:hypothetical protein